MRHPAAMTWVIALGLIAQGYGHQAVAEDWQYSAELYALGADVDVATSFGKDLGADFDDILDNLEFAVFGSLAATRGKFSLYGNLFYVDVDADKNRDIGPATAKLDVGLENIVSTLGAGWAVYESDSARFNLAAGARYLSMDADYELEIEPLGKRSGGNSKSFWDGVLGVQGRKDLSELWYLSYYTDIGTGESDLTWQAVASVSYRFSALDLTLGYQYLRWEFDDKLAEDLEIAGPALGLRFHW